MTVKEISFFLALIFLVVFILGVSEAVNIKICMSVKFVYTYEINALMSGGQVGLPQMPSFAEASAAQPVDYVGAASAQASANAAANPTNALLGLGADLGGAYLQANPFK